MTEQALFAEVVAAVVGEESGFARSWYSPSSSIGIARTYLYTIYVMNQLGTSTSTWEINPIRRIAAIFLANSDLRTSQSNHSTSTEVLHRTAHYSYPLDHQLVITKEIVESRLRGYYKLFVASADGLYRLWQPDLWGWVRSSYRFWRSSRSGKIVHWKFEAFYRHLAV